MPLPTIRCHQCGKQFYALQAIQGIFCSPVCRYRYNHGLPPEDITTTPQINTAEQELEIEDDSPDALDAAWERAGIKYEEMTKKAILREHYTDFQQSIIIAGNGANLSVKNDALVIKHGITYSPQEVLSEEFHRAVHNVRRIVWSAATGNISYAAMNWCHQQGIDVLILNKDGRIVCEINPDRYANIRLKRAQYKIVPEQEISIARWLILGKILGQFSTYNSYPELQTLRTTDVFNVTLHELSNEKNASRLDLTAIRLHEASAQSRWDLTQVVRSSKIGASR